MAFVPHLRQSTHALHLFAGATSTSLARARRMPPWPCPKIIPRSRWSIRAVRLCPLLPGMLFVTSILVLLRKNESSSTDVVRLWVRVFANTRSVTHAFALRVPHMPVGLRRRGERTFFDAPCGGVLNKPYRLLPPPPPTATPSRISWLPGMSSPWCSRRQRRGSTAAGSCTQTETLLARQDNRGLIKRKRPFGRFPYVVGSCF